MIALTLGALLFTVPQDQTVEERIRELETRLGALEKRAAAAKVENESLKKRLAAAERAKERIIRARAAGWVKKFARPAGLSDERCGELDKLWIGWGRADFGKRTDPVTWKTREAALKKRLTPEEAAQVAKAVRNSQEEFSRSAVSKFATQAKIGKAGAAALESAVQGRLEFADSALLLSAHPERQVDWAAVHRAVKGAVPGLKESLTEEEQTRLQALVEKWKPRTMRIQYRAVEKKK